MGSAASVKNWPQAYFLTVNGPDDLPPGAPYLEVYPVWSIAVTRNVKQLAAATSDHKINLWCLFTKNLLIALSGHAETIWYLAYSPDDSLLCSTSADGTVKLWETNTGKLAMTLPKHHANWVWTVAWSSDSERLATGGSDSRILVWDAVKAVEAARKAEFTREQAARDPAWADSAAYDQDEAQRKATPLVYWQGHEKSILMLDFAPTEANMLVSVGAEGTIAIWDAEVGALDCRLCGHIGAVNCVTIHPTISEIIASGGEDHTVRLWDLRDVDPGSAMARISREKATGLNLPHYTLKGHEGGVAQVEFCGDGQLLASASKDCEVRIWIPNMQNPLLLTRFVAHEAWIRDLRWASDQSLLFTCSSDGMVYAWEVPKKYHRQALKGQKKYEK